MDLTAIGSIPLRMVTARLRKVGKLAGHTPQSVACVAKAASCRNDPATVDGHISGRQVAVIDSEACVSVIEKAVAAGKVSRETVNGIARWAVGKRGGSVEAAKERKSYVIDHCADCRHSRASHGATNCGNTGCDCTGGFKATRTTTIVNEAGIEEGESVEIVESEEASVPEVATVKPRPPATSIDALIDARIEDRLAGFKPETAISAADVRKIVQEVALETAQTIKIVISLPTGGTVECKDEHFMFPRLVRLLGAGIHVYLWGPAGSGKTTAVLRAAKALGKESEIDTLDPSTPKSGILGYRTPTGDPAETAFTRMYARGGIYVSDECDNAPAHVQSLFNSALANGHAPTAWGQIGRGPGFGFGGTGNTPGRPTPSFPDRRPMSAAFADRLYFMYWPLDPGIECRAAGISVPRYPTRKEVTCTASEWVTWVRSVREWAERNAPTLMITPRASLLGMQALACGETPEEAANGLVFRGADKTLVAKALDAVSLPGNG